MSKQPVFNKRMTDPRLENLLGRANRAKRESHEEAAAALPPPGQIDPFTAELLMRLQRSSTFEEAAGVLLRTTLALTAEGLRKVSAGHDMRLLRAMVHLRPAGGYRGLQVLQYGQAEVSAPDTAELLPSATVWRLVEQYNTSVALDVNLGEAQPSGHPRQSLSSSVREPRMMATLGPPVESSRLRLLQRDTTHVLAIPLRIVHSEVVGMVSLEVHAEGQVGLAFPWQVVSEQLELLAQLAAPYLTLRPSRPRQPALSDARLPVVGESMTPLYTLLKCFAMQEETVLLFGPTGSGKSRLAEWIHSHSKRADKPFVRAVLANNPEQLHSSRLFGHMKGAFTGATANTHGLLHEAEGGTFFLDEIDKLTHNEQVSLLELLENRVYRPLGSSKPRQANVRFIVATNRDLRKLVDEGTFLLDLYFRINVLPIHLPPLRARGDELVGWAEYMIAAFRRANGLSSGVIQLSPEAVQVLHDYDWPGNLRELDNVLRRAYIIGSMRANATESFHLDGETLRLALRQGTSGVIASSQSRLLSRMLMLARDYVEEARARRDAGGCMNLELAEHFPGLVMAVASDVLHGRKPAFGLFGLEKLVENRNDARTFERMLSGFLTAIQKNQLQPGDELNRLLKDSDWVK